MKRRPLACPPRSCAEQFDGELPLRMDELRYLCKHVPQHSIASLWPKVVARTDELLVIAEAVLPFYEQALRNL